MTHAFTRWVEYPRIEHPARSKYSVLHTVPYWLRDVDTGVRSGENTQLKSQSFRVATKHPAHVLDPLSKGRCVVLRMDVPARKSVRRVASQRNYEVVVVSPGELFGAPRGHFLVSVVNRGSALIRPLQSSDVSRLILAGMPKHLATALMDQIRRIILRS